MNDASIEPNPTSTHNRPHSPLRTLVLYLILLLVLIFAALVFATAFTIDDWSRDLSMNRAETSADAKDPQIGRAHV